MSKLLSIIVPYVVLALVFVAQVQLAAYGFMSPLESGTLSVLDQLAKGPDIYACEWGRPAVFAPVLQPLYALATFLCGGYGGIVYAMRVMFVAVDFVVALVAYRVLSNGTDRFASLLVALAYLVLVPNGASQLGPYGVGLTCAFAAGLLVKSTYLAALEDDGTSLGYMRVLRPVLAGFLIVCAGLFSSSVGIACAIMLVFAWIYFRNADYAPSRVPLAWMLCGAVLAVACYLLLVLGYGELEAVLRPLASGGGRAHLDTGLVCEFAVLALLGALTLSAADGETKTAKTTAMITLALALIGTAIQFAGSAAPALVDGIRVQEGLAKDLICSSKDAQVYEDVSELAQKTDSDDVYVIGGDDVSWAYLLLDGQRADNEPQWVLKVGSPDGVKDAFAMQNCGKIASNSTCELYHRAATIGSISQG